MATCSTTAEQLSHKHLAIAMMARATTSQFDGVVHPPNVPPVCMYVNCPPVPNNGTSNQCACSTERPSISGYIPTMVRMLEFGSLPVWQAGVNQQPSCSILPPGFTPKELVNSLRREPWACPWSPPTCQRVHQPIHPRRSKSNQIRGTQANPR